MLRREERVLERVRAGDRTAYEIAAKLGLVREGFGNPAHLLARPLASLRRRGAIEAERDPANRTQLLYRATGFAPQPAADAARDEAAMSVRAKFKVEKIEISQHERDSGKKDENGRAVYEKVEMRSIVASPVYANGDPNHENSKFWTWTPSGKLELGTINPEAWAPFKIGQEVYLDITPA